MFNLGSDVRIHIESNTLFTYPDISIICGEIITLNNDDYNVLNPTVIIEILSPSTKNFDRSETFKLYRNIQITGNLRNTILLRKNFILEQLMKVF